MDFGGKQTAGEVLDRIRRESRDESEKGRWFEQLFMRLALQEPEFEIDAVWRWPDWPEREELTRRDGRDIGIDLVARRTSGEWVAIQCKCYSVGAHRRGQTRQGRRCTSSRLQIHESPHSRAGLGRRAGNSPAPRIER